MQRAKVVTKVRRTAVCFPQVKQQSLDLLKRRDDKDDLVESQISVISAQLSPELAELSMSGSEGCTGPALGQHRGTGYE